MLEEAGRDATEAFEDVGHSDEARELLGPMFLGDFVGEVYVETSYTRFIISLTTLTRP
jgi:cytochrome b involved in lipid metabolism